MSAQFRDPRGIGGIVMNLSRDELCDLMVDIAKRLGEQFPRRELMEATKREVRQRGLWTPEDDRDSKSADPKSLGLADIDFAFSRLAAEKRILRIRHGVWHLPDDHA